MDLTRDCYFSYTYDLTNTLQTNMLAASSDGGPPKINDMFVWNTYLKQPLVDLAPPSSAAGGASPSSATLDSHTTATAPNNDLDADSTGLIRSPHEWFISVIYGYFDQAKVPPLHHC